ncbi:hypothetical protein ASC77_01275 [Nocardioides sp. Root1257]|uniref:hypothetical protein n=1 Tax=unclassified Nocardioides TaxID=2615069 RepID=UPI0006F3D52D|nr:MULTISPECIES: hypothetical protein [unclassified Nocardioides]KQW52966.1 hypothetical protein ASC77_01275 [Nocardioides sp. Root1257]KRC55654.1 hypothetical protein ASE24_01275 [Nocardioides sp. Root224]
MKRSLAAALATVLVAPLGVVLLGAEPASAQTLSVSDPQGDVGIKTLDILSVSVQNLDRQVVAAIEVEDATRDGNLTVSIDPRGGTGVRVISKFRATGGTKNYLLRKAFTDPGSSKQKIRCRVRLGDAWSAAGHPVITLRFPSRCLAGGNYGALRFAAISSLAHERDVAPVDKRGQLSVSDWVARG